MKYLKSNLEVQAAQLTKESFDDFLEMMLGKNDEDIVFTDEMKEEIISKGFGMQTPNGTLHINRNDWLVNDNGKIILYSDKEFKKAFVSEDEMN